MSWVIDIALVKGLKNPMKRRWNGIRKPQNRDMQALKMSWVIDITLVQVLNNPMKRR